MEKIISFLSHADAFFPTLGLRFTLSGLGVVSTSGLGVSAGACEPETKLKLRNDSSESADTVDIFDGKVGIFKDSQRARAQSPNFCLRQT